MPKSEMAMLVGVENCWRMEPADSDVAANWKVGSFSISRTRPSNAGSAAR